MKGEKIKIMNIKKHLLEVICAALAGTMLASMLLPTFATEVIITETPMDEAVGGGADWTVYEEKYENTAVAYQQSASYFVTITKTIALGANKQAPYSVKVSGEIGSNQRVYVAPVDGIANTSSIDFYMREKDSKKEDVVATVAQKKVYWNSEDVANTYEETDNSVSAPNLTAGTWEGTFQVEIRLETEKDANPYETAPASAYSNWNYTLDNTNNIITLNYYTGTETDVIVYANYEVDGKLYKTQIKSNDASGNSPYNVAYMFNGYAKANCKNIKTIIFSKEIDTSNVTNMYGMFMTCSNLVNLDLGSFDTSNVTNMCGMFSQCNALTSVDVSSFDTSNVTNMNSLFNQCRSLTSLDLSSFDTSKVTDMMSMFNTCSKLKTIYATEGKWSTSKAKTTNMFTSCGTSSVTYK